jgi:vacuolar-type H+-ATPase subunit H
MGQRVGKAARADASPPLLETIRRKEAEVKRRLAVEDEAAQARLVEAEHRACALIAAAEAEGQREGGLQRQRALAEAEHEASALLAQARAEAERLQRVGAEQMEAAVQQAVALMIGIRR